MGGAQLSAVSRTPGTASTAVRISRRYWFNRAGSGKRSVAIGMPIVSTLVESRPASTFSRRKKLRIISPEPTSSTNASATSATIRASRRRLCEAPPLDPRPPSFIDPAQIGRRRLPGRGEAEQQAGRRRDGQRKEQHADVHRDLGFACEGERRHQELQPPHDAVAERDAEHAAAQREHDVLGDELSDQPPPPGAERRRGPRPRARATGPARAPGWRGSRSRSAGPVPWRSSARGATCEDPGR